MLTRRRVLSVASVLALLAGGASAVPPPNLITYQGIARQNGELLTGTRPVTFRLYESAASILPIMNESQASVSFASGLFTTNLGTGVITDGPATGTYTNYQTIFADFAEVWIETVIDGVALAPRQRLTSVPYALSSRFASDLADVSVVNGSTWLVTGLTSQLTIDGNNLILQLGGSNADLTQLQGRLRMRGADSGADADQSILFLNNNNPDAEFIRWDDSEDRFSISDMLNVTGPLQVGAASASSTEAFSRIGSATSGTGAMNGSGDLLVSDDLEVATTLLVGTDIRIRPGQPEGDGIIYFRDDSNDLNESFSWDDSADRFSVSDDLYVDGNLTLFNASTNFANIQSIGGVTIRIDTDNNESGQSAGTFNIVANSANVLGDPLLRLQSTANANLELAAGVTTNAFDFAEAFRPTLADFAMEPGDVVALAVGPGQAEHVALTTAAGQAHLLGVVSTKPAFVCGMGIGAEEAADPALHALQNHLAQSGDLSGAAMIGTLLEERVKQEWRPIAMLGRVPCKVDTRFGAIKAGDRLTSSPTKGHAMKQTGPGMSLGIALEDASEPGKIMILVRPMWYGGSAEDFGNVAHRDHADSQIVQTAGGERRVSTAQMATRVAELESETAELRAKLADLERLLRKNLRD